MVRLTVSVILRKFLGFSIMEYASMNDPNWINSHADQRRNITRFYR